MPRKRIRTTENRSYSAAALQEACQEVVTQGRTTRSVAIQFKIPRITLKRYVDKCREKNNLDINFRPNNEHLMAFSPNEELLLKNYLQHASNIHYGLSSKQARILAYEFAVANNKTLKGNWSREAMAGKEWMFNFMNRHNFSLRTPEQTSLSRATSFNKTNVEAFFRNLRELKVRYNLEGNDIYNLDETGVTTVHKPPKVLAIKGKRNVGQMTSAERGTLVTVVGIIGATGRYVPPFLIFPRVHFKENMLHGTPPGSKGAATPSGWMNSQLFLPVLQHFVQNERPSKEQPKLIILDNHESHLSIAALNFAKQNGIILLTLPPHCSHKLQPLDVGVFGPLKKYYGASCDRWMVNHAGRPITIYDVGSLVGEAFLQAFTPKNICSGFRASGIEPFNDQIFSDDEFLSSYVTDRPQISQGEASQAGPSQAGPSQAGPSQAGPSQAGPSQAGPSRAGPSQVEPSLPGPSQSQHSGAGPSQTKVSQAGPSQANSSYVEPLQVAGPHTELPLHSASMKEIMSKIISPEQIRPYPKAEPRKSTTRRKKGKSLILTDTPIKENIEEEARLREEKNNKKNKRTENKKEAVKRRILDDSSSSDNESVTYQESLDSPEEFDEYDDNPQDISNGDYVIVKVYGQNKSNFRHYVVQINNDAKNGFNITFLKRHSGTKYFFVTNEIGFVPLEDVVCKLPMPVKSSSARYANMISFHVEFNEFDFTVY